ncbi:hypothetical protein HMPREF1051_2412 [Neisseria sicca VK64]|uniref:Uncharacterized protein n=1 Tax=Neisseria sicca VK64 TaxID=1095748 RepID=I2NSN2_NEISI|nr:hypothetical protein HMPREF1051_2412 [Neisseria sicca VK64]
MSGSSEKGRLKTYPSLKPHRFRINHESKSDQSVRQISN